MVDLTSLQHDLLYAPVLIIVSIAVKFAVNKFGWAIEEKLIAQIATFFIILLTKILSNSVRRNPQAQGHAFNIRSEIAMLRDRLKPPKITLG